MIKFIFFLLVLGFIALGYSQYQMNQKLITLTNQENQTHLDLVQEFGPCWGVPAGQCQQ